MIAPHPGLSEGQRKAFELDYGMEEGVLFERSAEGVSLLRPKRLGLTGELARAAPGPTHCFGYTKGSPGGFGRELGGRRPSWALGARLPVHGDNPRG